MKYMEISAVRNVLAIHPDKIITVTFTKRTTGEVRVLTGRLGVSQYVTGEGLRFVPSDKNLFTIFDMALAAKLPKERRKEAYRCIPMDTVINIKAQGITYS